jgi:hypothetical protein
LLLVSVMLAALALVAAPAGPAASAEKTGSQPSGALLEGRLEGDSSLEGGCAWLATGATRHEVWWPDGYEVRFEPLRLIDPSGHVVAVEGDVVAVRGRHVPDAATICQVGSVFDADAVVR